MSKPLNRPRQWTHDKLELVFALVTSDEFDTEAVCHALRIRYGKARGFHGAITRGIEAGMIARTRKGRFVRCAPNVEAWGL